MAERKPDEFLLGLAAQAARDASSNPARAVIEQLTVEGRQPLDERLSLRPPHAAGHDLELGATRSSRSSNPASRAPVACAEVRRLSTRSICAGSDGPRRTRLPPSAFPTRRVSPGRATPLVECIENVSVTEIDPDRPTSRTLGVRTARNIDRFRDRPP